MSTLDIFLEPLSWTNDGINASGCNVGSDEYSKPSFMILVFLTLPIVWDFGKTFTSLIVVVPTLTKDGNFL